MCDTQSMSLILIMQENCVFYHNKGHIIEKYKLPFIMQHYIYHDIIDDVIQSEGHFYCVIILHPYRISLSGDR